MAIQITSEQIKNSNIITALIANDAVTSSKLDQTGTFDFSGGSLSVATPTADGHATTKAYVDSLVSGLHWKDAARVATTASLSVTYNNGSSGVGATLTATGNGAISIDGVSLSSGDRVLVKDQSAAKEQNGLYQVSTVGDASTAFVLTRTTDADTPAKLASLAIFVLEGTSNSDAGYVLTSDGISAIGTDAIEFAQFSGAGSVTAGDGLTKSGNTLSVDLDTDPGLEFNSGKLKAKVDGATLGLDSSGLKVADGGVGTTQLGAAAVTSAKIATAAVGSSQLAGSAVTSAKLADGAVGSSAKIADGVVTAAKIANDAIDQTKIADGAVQREHLNANVVNTAGALGLDPTNNDLLVITDDSTIEITGSNDLAIKDGGVSTAKIAANAVTAAKLASNAVVSDKIASSAVTSTKIANNAVQAIHLNSDVVLTGGGLGLDGTGNELFIQIDDSTTAINGTGELEVKDGGVSTAKIADSAVTAAKLASNAVVEAKIAANAVTSTKIADGAIASTAKLADGIVTGAKIADGTIELGKLTFAMNQEEFTGNSSTTAFELAKPAAGLDSVQVFRNGLRMRKVSTPSAADEYSVANSGTGSAAVVTFGSAPDTGDVVYVDYLG